MKEGFSAKVHSVKILSDQGSGSFSWFIQGLDWIMQHGKKPAVVSASLGGSGVVQSVGAAVKAAVSSGITVVVAAGNEGATNDPSACTKSPAFAPDAITVGSTNVRDGRSYFSNIGECVDIFAPGSSIRSAGIDSNVADDTLSGTSMACPHVAGVAALLLEEDSQRTPAQVRARMMQLATRGAISDVGVDSPNKLLCIGKGCGVGDELPPMSAGCTSFGTKVRLAQETNPRLCLQAAPGKIAVQACSQFDLKQQFTVPFGCPGPVKWNLSPWPYQCLKGAAEKKKKPTLQLAACDEDDKGQIFKFEDTQLKWNERPELCVDTTAWQRRGVRLARCKSNNKNQLFELR